MIEHAPYCDVPMKQVIDSLLSNNFLPRNNPEENEINSSRPKWFSLAGTNIKVRVKPYLTILYFTHGHELNSISRIAAINTRDIDSIKRAVESLQIQS